MKATELRQLSEDDLLKKISECEEEMFNLRIKGAFSPLDKPKRLAELRKMIARCNTIKNERKKGDKK